MTTTSSHTHERAVLDAAIALGLTVAGGKVRKRLKQLKRALAEVDAVRAEHERPAAAPNGCDDCSVEPGERHRYAACPGNREVTS